MLLECNDEEIDLLVELLPLKPGSERDCIANSMRKISSLREMSLNEAMTAALDELWEPILRPHVERMLTEYRDSVKLPLQQTPVANAGTSIFGLKGEFPTGNDLIQIKSESPKP